MLKREHFPQVFGVATLALIFSAASVYPQATTDSAASPAGSGSSAQTSPGSASSGGSGPTSATGQSGTSSSGASSAASDASDKSAAGGLSKSDQNLMRQMAYANLAEIETGKLAQSNSKNEQVRAFAQQMIDDHTKAQDELQQLADAKGVKLPTEPDSKHKAAMKKLSSLSGEAFDKAYMKQGGVNDHRQTHKLLQNAQKKASDPDLQALAQKTLPTIEQHLKLARETSAGISGAARASGSSGSTDTSGGSGGASGSGAPGGAGSKSDTGK